MIKILRFKHFCLLAACAVYFSITSANAAPRAAKSIDFKSLTQVIKLKNAAGKKFLCAYVGKKKGWLPGQKQKKLFVPDTKKAHAKLCKNAAAALVPSPTPTQAPQATVDYRSLTLAEIPPAQICEMVKNGETREGLIDITKPNEALDITPADPSGQSDSYHAFESAAKYFSNKNDGLHRVLVLPRGRYKLDQYISDFRNYPYVPYKSPAYENASNFRIIGCNAYVSVKGDFRKTRWYELGNTELYTPLQGALVPFMFVRCSNFGLHGVDMDGSADGYGLELDGQINKGMSREAGVVENADHGIYTIGSSDYTINNIYTHHFAGDGILVGQGYEDPSYDYTKDGKIYRVRFADYNGIIDHVLSSNNARQGISVIQVKGLLVKNSIFQRTGRTGNGMEVSPAFPNFAPGAGLDIEPDLTVEPHCVDYPQWNNTICYYMNNRTEDLRFENCTFRDNLGVQLGSGSPTAAAIHNVSFINTTVKATYDPKNVNLTTTPNSYGIAVLMEVDGAFFQGGTFDTGMGMFAFSDWTGSKTTIKDLTIKSKYVGLITDGDGLADVSNVTLIGEHTGPIDNYFPWIRTRNPLSTFHNNTIFLPAALHKTPEYTFTSLIEGFCSGDKPKVYQNKFLSDFKPSGGKKGFAISYSGTNILSPGEIFPSNGTVVGVGGPISAAGVFLKNLCN